MWNSLNNNNITLRAIIASLLQLCPVKAGAPETGLISTYCTIHLDKKGV